LSKVCTVTNTLYSITVPLKNYNAWKDGEYIQRAFSTLSPGDREFVKSGTTPAEWDKMFKGSEE